MRKWFLLTFFLLSTVGLVVAQSSAELKKKRTAINREIANLRLARSKIDKNKKASLSQINLLNAQIRLREEKISTINTEIRLLDAKIQTNTSEVITLQSNLRKLKQEYAKMVEFAFRNQGAYNKLMFVFAADNFNQAYKRLKYIQQVGQYRKSQARAIQRSQANLKQEIVRLDANKKEKSELLSDQLKEKETLGKDKQQQSRIVSNLSKQEKTLQQQITKKQREATALNNAIQAAIKREVLAAQKRAAEAERARKAKLAAAAKAAGSRAVPAKAAPAASSKSALASSPADAKLSSNFVSNRGRLPRPVQGIVTQGYGHYKYRSNVSMFNPGINIKTSAGAPVKAVFNGQVMSVAKIASTYAVMVRHGQYISVYYKLKSVSVSSGQSVTTGQTVGLVATDPADGISEMQFQLWKDTSSIDPTSWLSR